jgi:hypothetical protein
VWPVLLLGCLHRRDGGDALSSLLSRADAAWDERAVGGLEPVSALLDEAWALDQRDPEVLWRLSRLHVAQGLAATDDRTALVEFGTARSIGLDCLDVGAALQRQETVEDAALVLRRVDRSEAACAAWASVAWGQWLFLFGADAAALDVDRIALLVERAAEIGGDGDLVAWGRGLVYAARGDYGRARRELEDALSGPEEWAVRADLVRRVGEASGDPALVERERVALSAREPSTPEERGVLVRLAAITP